MGKCKNLKIKIGNIPYCKLKNKQIIYRQDCKECKDYNFDRKNVSYSSFKSQSDELTTKNKTLLKMAKNGIKQKSKKLSKLEKARKSLFTSNLSKCYFCPNDKDHMHEIFAGKNRQNSMRYNLCLPICWQCHQKYQNDAIFNEEWHIKGQLKFIEFYPELNFLEIFKINYL